MSDPGRKEWGMCNGHHVRQCVQAACANIREHITEIEKAWMKDDLPLEVQPRSDSLMALQNLLRAELALLKLSQHIKENPYHFKEHSQDADCTLDEDGMCTICGVLHGEPCPECGGRGFHKPDCMNQYAMKVRSV